jgi:integrase
MLLISFRASAPYGQGGRLENIRTADRVPEKTLGSQNRRKDWEIRTATRSRRAVKKLSFNEGIEDRREKFTFRGLRHTAATFLIASGVDMYTVKSILGHSTIALTEGYSHLANDALKEAAKKMPVLTGDQAGQGKVAKVK